MQQWKLSTASYYPGERETVWRDAMTQICLPMAVPAAGQDDFFGDVVNVVSPLGIEFSCVRASAQTLSGACSTHPDAIWLALLLDGRSILQDDAATPSRQPLEANDILYGPTGVDSTLQLPSEFRMLYVKIPRQVLHPRLVNPTLLGVGALSGRAGAGRMLACLLRTVAEDLEGLDDDTLRPIETALAEFVVACLGERAGICSFGSPARSAHFNQICQSIESQLGDPDLGLAGLAVQQRVSPRYIQKLFEEAGLSFGQYVRQRRLDNCRRELANPLYRKLSISEICFRWGFNDAAHFSRSFHQQYGVTPRAFRQAGGQEPCPAAATLQ